MPPIDYVLASTRTGRGGDVAKNMLRKIPAVTSAKPLGMYALDKVLVEISIPDQGNDSAKRLRRMYEKMKGMDGVTEIELLGTANSSFERTEEGIKKKDV